MHDTLMLAHQHCAALQPSAWLLSLSQTIERVGQRAVEFAEAFLLQAMRNEPCDQVSREACRRGLPVELPEPTTQAVKALRLQRVDLLREPIPGGLRRRGIRRLRAHGQAAPEVIWYVVTFSPAAFELDTTNPRLRRPVKAARVVWGILAEWVVQTGAETLLEPSN